MANQFKVNAESVTVLGSDGQSKVLKRNETHNTEDFDSNSLLSFFGNGKRGLDENGKEIWVYKPSLSLVGNSKLPKSTGTRIELTDEGKTQATKKSIVKDAKANGSTAASNTAKKDVNEGDENK